MNYKKLTYMGLCTLNIVAPCISKEAKERNKGKSPNIIFMMSDDHAYQAISAYGSMLNKTPNIDRIANEGALFTRNFCANSISSPSRACVLTGKHSHLNGVLTWESIDTSQVTFPNILHSHGYTTGIFGKWHLGSTPAGFDE
jgi:N-acetylglucosamine-6-sulfatase